jgi:hypothetical protein
MVFIKTKQVQMPLFVMQSSAVPLFRICNPEPLSLGFLAWHDLQSCLLRITNTAIWFRHYKWRNPKNPEDQESYCAEWKSNSDVFASQPYQTNYI